MAERQPVTLALLLAEVKSRLSDIGIDDPALEARMIVEHYSGTTRTDAIARPDLPISDDAASNIRAALERRLRGEPVHRIFGFRDFHGVRLKLSAETLEPRPDTETLVDAVLPHLRETVRTTGSCRILDLGTGTGAVAIALLHAVSQATGVATDISEDALATAAENARMAGIGSRLTFSRSDWFKKKSGRFHAIVSNPPYITTSDIAGLDREVRDFDPHRALDGGPDGLDAYRAIAVGSASHLEENGIVALEIGHTQKDAVTRVFAQAGFQPGGVFRDLAGTERVLVFSR
ncbi:MAG TPA: peptide chain release factor N(5)-glutamine methyltransferase [Rhizobiaceae bacterium]|nr:peptide chain release factor N(5)-glutamine methyltransferase [Rhizobiaceae bacterium]